MMTLDGGRNGIAAQAVGIAQGALDAAIDYAKERINLVSQLQHNQGIGFKLADMATNIEAARLLTYQAAWLESDGLAVRKRIGDVKVICWRHGDEGDNRSGTSIWRLWLYKGLSS